MALDIGPVLRTGVCMHTHTQTHINDGVIFWRPLPPVAAGHHLAEQRVCMGPHILTAVLLYSMGDSHFTATTFLDAWSLILLLFKSDMSDYAVLALHNAAKIKQKIQRLSGLS